MQTHTSGIFYCLRFSRAALGWRTCMALAMWGPCHVEEMLLHGGSVGEGN